MDPKPYNMKSLTDRKRWFMEMKGYFRVSEFLSDGTDREGRHYAMDGFLELEKICCRSPKDASLSKGDSGERSLKQYEDFYVKLQEIRRTADGFDKFVHQTEKLMDDLESRVEHG